MLYQDIHTHSRGVSHKWEIRNLHKLFEEVQNGGYYSIGLHPWYINENTFVETMADLEKWSRFQSVLAIGECGLDKVCTTDFSLQEKAFIAQILLANKINKPIIVHCVRAYQEVMQLLQQHNNRVPVIFHGFNKNKEVADQLIKKGYYLSFGKIIEQASTQELVASLPLQQIFFETDDATIGIEEIFAIAAAALKIDTFSLSLQIKKNVARVFGNDLF